VRRAREVKKRLEKEKKNGQEEDRRIRQEVT